MAILTGGTAIPVPAPAVATDYRIIDGGQRFSEILISRVVALELHGSDNLTFNRAEGEPVQFRIPSGRSITLRVGMGMEVFLQQTTNEAQDVRYDGPVVQMASTGYHTR